MHLLLFDLVLDLLPCLITAALLWLVLAGSCGAGWQPFDSMHCITVQQSGNVHAVSGHSTTCMCGNMLLTIFLLVGFGMAGLSLFLPLLLLLLLLGLSCIHARLQVPCLG